MALTELVETREEHQRYKILARVPAPALLAMMYRQREAERPGWHENQVAFADLLGAGAGRGVFG
jgi:hypothetical protein